MKNKTVRISKIISHSGVCSRRDAEELIRKGMVKINDCIFKDYYVDKELIKNIEVNGKILEKQKTKVWSFYKPKGYVSSNKEQKNQISFFKLIPNNIPRIVSVGRLDIESEGLLLLTNNPTLSSFLEKPSNEIKRKYRVKVLGKLPKNLKKVTKETLIINGVIYKKLTISVMWKKSLSSYLEIEIKEGKNREIRKIMTFFGLKVIELKRISFGPFELGTLKPGNLEIIKNEKLGKHFQQIGFIDENYFW